MAAVDIKVVSSYDGAGVAAAQRSMAGLSKNAMGATSGVSKAMKGIGIAAAVGAGATLAVGKALFDMGKEAQAAASITRTTEQILKTTGASAWTTSGAISDLADSISKKTGMDDEAIQSASNLLLTFKNVKNAGEGQAAVFDRATAAAADLSAAGFGSVDSAAKMLGKALNDPTVGLTALSRAGVTFTDQQKEQIKALQESGDLLGAQAIIMGEVESQVGGVAEAAASPFDKLNVLLGNFKETIGAAILPAISSIVDAIGPVLDMLSGPLASIAGELGNLIASVFQQLQPILPPLVEALVKIVGVLAGGFITALQAILPAIIPVVAIIADLATRIAPILAPILEKVGTLIGALLEAVMPLIGPLADLILNIFDKASPIIDLVATNISNLIDALAPIIAAISNLLPFIDLLITALFGILTPLLQVLVPAIDVLVGMLSDQLVRAIGVVTTGLGYLVLGLAKIAPFVWEHVYKPVVKAFFDMAGKVLHSAQAMVGWVPVLKGPLNDAVAQFDGMREGVMASIDSTVATVSTEGERIGQEMVDSGLAAIMDPSKAQAAGSTFGSNIAFGLAGQQKRAYEAGRLLREAAIDGIGSRRIAEALQFTETPFTPAPVTAPAVTTSSGTTADKPKNPFKDFMDSIQTSVEQLRTKAKLMAAGVPEALADSIIGAEGWKTVANRLLNGGRAALAKFIDLWTNSAEGKSAIQAMVDGIVDGAKKQADRLKKALDDFLTVQRDFTKSMMSTASLGSFKPADGVPITGEGITANLRQRLQALRDFRDAIGQLQNPTTAGVPPLNKAMLTELYSMGPIEGLAYAKALLADQANLVAGLNDLQTQFATPASVLGQGYAELTTGTTQAALQSAQNFEVQAGAITINVNGEVSAATVTAIRQAVTDALTGIGSEARGGRRTGVR